MQERWAFILETSFNSCWQRGLSTEAIERLESRLDIRVVFEGVGGWFGPAPV